MQSKPRTLTAAALLCAAMLTILSNMIISPALPGLEKAFADNDRAELLVRMLVTAPSIMVAILAPFAGSLADRFGKRSQLLGGVMLFAAAGTAGLWMPSLETILVSRLALGVAVALVMTAQTALTGDYFTGASRGRFIGLQLASTNLGGLAMVLLSGWLAARSPFLPFAIYGVALLMLPVMWIGIGEPERGGSVTLEEHSGGSTSWAAKLASVVALGCVTLVGFYIIPTQIPFFLASNGHPAPSATAWAQAATTFAAGILSLLYGRIRPAIGAGDIGQRLRAHGRGLRRAVALRGPVGHTGILCGDRGRIRDPVSVLHQRCTRHSPRHSQRPGIGSDDRCDLHRPVPVADHKPVRDRTGGLPCHLHRLGGRLRGGGLHGPHAVQKVRVGPLRSLMRRARHTSAATTSPGRIGTDLKRTPMASWTALAIAADTPQHPSSPIPRAPISLACSSNSSTKPTSIASWGTSAFTGTATLDRFLARKRACVRSTIEASIVAFPHSQTIAPII